MFTSTDNFYFADWIIDWIQDGRYTIYYGVRDMYNLGKTLFFENANLSCEVERILDLSKEDIVNFEKLGEAYCLNVDRFVFNEYGFIAFK